MKNLILVVLISLISSLSYSQGSESVNHKLTVNINPETSEISVIDSINIIGEFKNEFLLNADLTPVSLTKDISLVKIVEDNYDKEYN